jgi:phosphatidylserine/phosphatidylglycerophosphate/cardiolipin synthase-like enzyme
MRPAILLLLSLLLATGTAAVAGPPPSPPPVQLLENAAFPPELLRAVREARRSVLFSYFLFKTTDRPRSVTRHLVEELTLARKRGVQVTVILEQSDNPRDDLNGQNRKTARLLSAGGVRVVFDSPGVTTHVKAAVIDDRTVFIGSHNLTQSALRHNNELSLRIDSPPLAAEIRSYLERL